MKQTNRKERLPELGVDDGDTEIIDCCVVEFCVSDDGDGEIDMVDCDFVVVSDDDDDVDAVMVGDTVKTCL